MRAGLGPCAALLLVIVASAPSVLAQTNLPPPPPPPINAGGTSSGGTSSGGTSSGGSDNNSTSSHKQKPHKPAEPAHTTAPPPTPPPPQHRDPDPPPRTFEPETPRTTSIRLNPLPFFVSRLSVDLEFMLAPHHALVVSPNVTFHKFAFHRSDTIAYGLGYAGDDSAGFGTEVGYHYWIRRHLQGIYVGPSLVLGATLPPSPAKTYGYYGAALDVGYQYLFSNGFTLNGGGGLLIVNATPTGSIVRAAPRFLFGIGWSF
jgi:opacity protein-like surface antigen